jgi:hypothetical protein
MNVWTALVMEVFALPMTTVPKVETSIETKFDVRYWFKTQVTINAKEYDFYE